MGNEIAYLMPPKQQRSQPYLLGGAKWKKFPDFCLFFPIFPDFFSIFPDFPPIFPDFFPMLGNFFAVRGGTLPPCHPIGYATAQKYNIS